MEFSFEVFTGDQHLKTEKVQGTTIRIGRLGSSHLLLDDPSVSRMHAVIEAGAAGEVSLVDLGSVAGTLVNGKKVSSAILQPGDEISVGNFRIKVNFETASATVPPPGVVAAGDMAPTPAAGSVQAARPGNPFASPAQVMSAQRQIQEALNPFSVRGKVESGDEQLIYGIAPSGPSIRPDQVESHEFAVEVSVLWGERSVLQVEHLHPPRAYYVGEPTPEHDVDFVINSSVIGANQIPVCDVRDGRVFAVIPGNASGELTIDGRAFSLELAKGQQLVQPSHATKNAFEFPIELNRAARYRVGDFTFIVRGVNAGKIVAGARRLDPRPYMYVGFAALLASFMLLMFYFAPPRPRGLASDLYDENSRLVQFLMQPDELEELKLKMNGAGEAGGTPGEAHVGEQGQLGAEENKKTHDRWGNKGPADNPDPQLAREKALKDAQNAGILGTLAAMRGAFNAPTSPFGADRALGVDPVSALGAMTGADIGANFGFGGLGMRGHGVGGGGTGEGTIGMGHGGRFGTMGAGGGHGTGYGKGAGGELGDRTSTVPQVRQGEAVVQGGLSKEVIRRIVRQHLNEVKFCYEQQLNARPDLEGRVKVMFVISPTGSVQSALVTETEIHNSVVEQCVARAVRRWVFPAPEGGGIVSVNYPFVLTAPGGTDES